MSSNFTVNRVCEQCGNIFIAKTTVTRFCSKACNSKNNKQKIRASKIAEADHQVRQVINHRIEELSSLEFLTVKAAAELLGASERIIYTMIRTGRLKATNLSVRKTVISRRDIDGLFDLLPAGPSVDIALTIENCYNIGEAQTKFNVSEKALFEIIKRNNISKFQQGKFTYVPKTALDSIFNLIK